MQMISRIEGQAQLKGKRLEIEGQVHSFDILISKF